MSSSQGEGLARIPRALSRLVLAAPLALLAGSLTIAPYVQQVRAVASIVPPAPEAPLLLYEHEGTSFFYVAAHLLHPEAFGTPGQYIETVVFDVWPVGEAVAQEHDNGTLTWVVSIWKAIMGEPLSLPTDVDVAESFRAAIGGRPRIGRGRVQVFELPPASAYRRRSGLTHFVALGTRIDNQSPSNSNRGPQLFPDAVALAFQELRRTGVRSVGVPRMIARTTIGEEGSRTASWQVILRAVDASARAAGIRTVLFGGWSLQPDVRELTDSAFHTAWDSRRHELAAEAESITHERLRLAAVVAFAALLRWHLRGRALGWLRVLALAPLAAGLSLTIGGAGRWLLTTAGTDARFIFATEFVLAIVAGCVIEQLVRFDPKKIIAEEDEPT